MCESQESFRDIGDPSTGFGCSATHDVISDREESGTLTPVAGLLGITS